MNFQLKNDEENECLGMPRNCLGIRLAAQAVLSKIDQKSRNRLLLLENVSICSKNVEIDQNTRIPAR